MSRRFGADAGPTFDNLLGKSTNHGQQAFRISGDDVRHACLRCDATFSQDDEGWEAKSDHEFREHGQANLFDWHDLHGKTLQIAVVEVEGDDDWFGKERTVDIYGRDEDGTVYHLHTGRTLGKDYDGEYGLRDWKWANAQHLPQLSGPKPTQSEAASPSNGCDSMGAR